jgi:hypothetical protein
LIGETVGHLREAVYGTVACVFILRGARRLETRLRFAEVAIGRLATSALAL